MAGITPPLSYTTQGQYTSNWWATTQIKMPEYQKEAVDKYGHLFELYEILKLIGKTISMKNDVYNIFEKESVERPITLADPASTGFGIATNAAGANITFKLATGDYDARGNAYLRIGDVIMVPKAYLQTGALVDANYVVQSTSGSGTATVYTAVPAQGASATTFAPAQITTGVPIGTQIAVTTDAYGRGTTQPRGTVSNWYARSFRTGIHKDTYEIEGGNASQTWIDINLDKNGMVVPTGTPGARSGLMLYGQKQMEILMDKKVNNALLMGQGFENTANGNVTNDAGESTPYITTTGLIPQMQLLAQQYAYTNSWDISNLDDIKPLLISQGLSAQDIMFMMGDLLYKDVENSAYNWIKEYGHDPIMTAMDSIGLQFRAMKKLGFNFIIRELHNLSNPNNYGLAAYGDYYRHLGIMIPMGDNPIREADGVTPGSISNLCLGFKNYDGENRERVNALSNGMTGYPFQTVTPVDTIKGYALTELALIATKVNQFVLLYQQ